MEIINTNNLNEVRKQIDKLRKKEETKNEKIAILSQDDEFNRKVLEIKGINILIINENLQVKDYGKQRNSGLNEVLAKLSKQKEVSIGIELDEIIKKTEKEKAKSIARLSQNIMLCKKAGTKLMFITQKNNKDKLALSALLITLGANTKQAFQAVKE